MQFVCIRGYPVNRCGLLVWNPGAGRCEQAAPGGDVKKLSTLGKLLFTFGRDLAGNSSKFLRISLDRDWHATCELPQCPRFAPQSDYGSYYPDARIFGFEDGYAEVQSARAKPRLGVVVA